jgi:hypothetical protein
MKRARHSHCRGEGGFGIWIIVLFIIAGGLWFLYSSRKDADRGGHAFAAEVARKIAVDYDERYLVQRLSPENQAARLPMWRERLFKNLRSFGPLAKPIETTGDVLFTSQFFDPHGTFRSELIYPTMAAHFDLSVSKGQNGWRIDELNLVWNPPPTPVPSPTAAMTPSPTPSPTPDAKQKRKRKG